MIRRVCLLWLLVAGSAYGQGSLRVDVRHAAEVGQVEALSRLNPVPLVAELAPGALMELTPRWNGNAKCMLLETVRVRVQVWVWPYNDAAWLDAPVLDTGERPCMRVVRAQVPESADLGSANVSLEVEGVEFVGGMYIARSHFGVLAWERAKLMRPFAPSSMVWVRGTGLGLAEASAIHAELDGQGLELVDVRRNADGLGVDELRFRLPAQLAGQGCYTPLAVSVEDRWTDSIPMTVSSNGPCVHPLGLRSEQLEMLDSGRAVPVGSLRFRLSERWSLGEFSVSFVLAKARTVEVWAFSGLEEGCRTGPVSLVYVPPPLALDAGTVSLRMPDGRSVQAPYEGALVAGEYLVEGMGGADVAPFRVNVKLPRLPEIVEPLRLSPGGEVLLEWDGSEYVEGDLVTVYQMNTMNLDTRCKTRARNGSMRLPPIGPFLGVQVERRVDTPLLFPLRLNNGQDFSGVVNYLVTDLLFSLWIP